MSTVYKDRGTAELDQITLEGFRLTLGKLTKMEFNTHNKITYLILILIVSIILCFNLENTCGEIHQKSTCF